MADDPTADLGYLTKQYPKTYGKVQDTHRARWLTRDELDRLLTACRDGRTLALRDELVIRLGFAGMRAAEIRNLRVADVHPDAIEWIGKGRRPRHVVPGPQLNVVIAAYLDQWHSEAPKGPRPTDALVCPSEAHGSTHGQRRPDRMLWGHMLGTRAVHHIVTTRAAAAGLGHVAPHDLRRTAAGLLSNAKSADGGHLFDLLDIQKVLGHADPATTVKSYLDPMDRAVNQRASSVLD
jgi:integrase